jgi:hypothetical protein
MPTRDAVRLIHATQEGALLHHPLILITLPFKERRSLGNRQERIVTSP